MGHGSNAQHIRNQAPSTKCSASMRRTAFIRLSLPLVIAVWVVQVRLVVAKGRKSTEYAAKSGIKTWVDPETPVDRQSYLSSRGRRWDLVMSDEFNFANRSFRPGDDHIWTSLEKPDGVNGALELLSHNMTSTECDETGTCYFFIRVVDEPTTLSVYNQYSNPPGYQKVNFFYRAGMVQSWNKFCFQGGMVEVRAQLPGAVTPESGNLDIAKGKNGVTDDNAFYPTWPGIWMMGNLGRAIFSASTNRMWPFSYDECNDAVFNSTKNQRISACNSSPGFGLNPNQGRGAPEIDILEGGGKAISSSIQVGPGMPRDFRLVPPDPKQDKDIYCLYYGGCNTPGANNPGVPTAFYNARGHLSWYQGLRYQSNPFCVADPKMKQDFLTVNTSITKGIKENSCSLALCPGSYDVYADLGLVDGKGTQHWGVNYNGTCFPKMNVYTGAYLCDPDNQDPLCSAPRNDSTPATNAMTPFNYQMDAISSNWPVHIGAYTDFLIYQIEWVTGSNGYVRWMLEGNVIFEITAETIENVNNSVGANPKKKMLDEPMYLIFNIAVSSSWGAHPIFDKTECRGDGTDPDKDKIAKAKKICDAYPMYLKIDYIRLYQDMASDLEAGNLMSIGCDPASHPTREWIEGNIGEYTDDQNPMIEVTGHAFCVTDDDCTIGFNDEMAHVSLSTGKCVKKRCACAFGASWGGSRCTLAHSTDTSFGPPLEAGLGVAVLVVLLTAVFVGVSMRVTKQEEAKISAKSAAERKMGALSESSNEGLALSTTNYSHNFV